MCIGCALWPKSEGWGQYGQSKPDKDKTLDIGTGLDQKIGEGLGTILPGVFTRLGQGQDVKASLWLLDMVHTGENQVHMVIPANISIDLDYYRNVPFHWFCAFLNLPLWPLCILLMGFIHWFISQHAYHKYIDMS